MLTPEFRPVDADCCKDYGDKLVVHVLKLALLDRVASPSETTEYFMGTFKVYIVTEMLESMS